MTEGWTEEERLPVLALVPHNSAIEHAPFLCKEFASMVEKGQWMVLSYLVAKGLLVLRLSLPRVKVKRDWRPCWLRNYSFYKTNSKTLPVACLSAMQYGHALDHLLHEIVFADPSLGTVYILKADVLDGFYRMGVRPEDATKISLIFPRGANE